MLVETLQNDPDYKLLLTLRHNNLLPFIQQYVFERSVTMMVFWGLNLLLLLALIWLGWSDISSGLVSWAILLKNVGLALLLLLTLIIVLHEAVHGLAYLMVGAKRVSFGMNLQEFYFYAIADRFVLSRPAFVFVALAPFIVISALLIGGLFCIGTEWKWLFYSLLFFHSGACVGDFAMLAFYEKHREFSELLTYDDRKEGLSYFYVK